MPHLCSITFLYLSLVYFNQSSVNQLINKASMASFQKAEFVVGIDSWKALFTIPQSLFLYLPHSDFCFGFYSNTQLLFYNSLSPSPTFHLSILTFCVPPTFLPLFPSPLCISSVTTKDTEGENRSQRQKIIYVCGIAATILSSFSVSSLVQLLLDPSSLY